MMQNDTFFAPPARTERRQFKNQLREISRSPIVDTLLTTFSGMLVILNEDRQIVALNHAFLEAIGIDDPESALGLRLGESLNCIHAHEAPHGCGTTPHCRTCGAAIAMMAAITEDRTDEEVCALTANRNGEPVDLALLIRAQPIVLENCRWILISAQDVTPQQFWSNLEHLFFHDVNNILTSLLGYSALALQDMPDNEDIKGINIAVQRLHAEVAMQKSLAYSRDTEYLVNLSGVSLEEIRRELGTMVKGHPAAVNKGLIETGFERELRFRTDPYLLTRVLGNMLINAFEATPENGEVRFGVRVTPEEIIWEVANPGVIPVEVQDRVFQRHYSTKARIGRGLGTYSMKLFGETCLGGRVSFSSSGEQGTVFVFRMPC